MNICQYAERSKRTVETLKYQRMIISTEHATTVLIIN